MTFAPLQPRVRALMAGVLLALLVVPATFAAGPARLEAGSVSGGGTSRTFEVTYVSRNDAPPSWVRVTLDGTARAMKPVDARDTIYRDGVRFRLTLTVGTGKHTFTFSALDSRERRSLSLSGGTFSIAAPATPVPRSTPPATPRPQPTPRPQATPQPAAQPTEAPATPRPTPTPPAPASPSPSAMASPSGDTPSVSHRALAPGLAAEPPSEPGGPGTGSAGAANPRDGRGRGNEPESGAAAGGTGTPGGTGGPGTGVTGPAGGGDPDESSASNLPGGPGSADLVLDAAGLPGFGSERWTRLAVWGATVSTTAGTITVMALFTLRRRRDPVEPEPDNTPEPTPARTIAPHIADDEDGIPRWRRPSLIAARKATPGGDLSAIAAQRLTFREADAPTDEQHERRWIRYRMVRLSDGPDEILSAEIGRLDAGDEVELLERAGVYWQVRTPTGHVGWVHRMTLGELVSAEANAPSGTRHAPQATEPAVTDGLAARLIRERAAGA